MLYPEEFDVIVVGGGHAGTEAALAAARMGAQDAAADPQHRDAGADELQPVDRRHRQGPPGEGGRCARRRDGDRHGRGRHPVPHPQFEQGPGRARHARAGRPRALQGGDPPPAGEPAEPVAVPAGGRRPDDRGRPRGRRRHAGGHCLPRAHGGADGRAPSSTAASTSASTTTRPAARATRRRSACRRG